MCPGPNSTIMVKNSNDISFEFYTQLLYYVTSSFLIVLLVEYITKKCQVYRPSQVLHFIGNQLENFFLYIGEQIARLSSFIVFFQDLFIYLDTVLQKLFKNLFKFVGEFLKELYILFTDIMIPLLNIFTSPICLIYGYVKKSRFYSLYYTIPIGTILAINILYLIYRCYYNISTEYLSLLCYNIIIILNIVITCNVVLKIY